MTPDLLIALGLAFAVLAVGLGVMAFFWGVGEYDDAFDLALHLDDED